MPQTSPAKRIEIVCDTPLIPLVTATLTSAGVKGWSVLEVASGSGRDGAWSHDEFTGAAAKSIIVTIARADATDRLTDALSPLLDRYGMLLIIGDVSVIRPERF
jgi:hypothetical protein